MPSDDRFPDGSFIPAWFFDAPSFPQLKEFRLDACGIPGDGKLHTQELQALIDRIASEGGGILTVPAGLWRTGALFFRTGVHLKLEEGATLKGSEDPWDYPLMTTRIEGQVCRYFPALINADRCDGFTIFGGGTVDGSGERSWRSFWLRRDWNPACTNKDEQRPRLVFISHSSHVALHGVTLQNSHFWTTHLYLCDHVRVEGCSFFSPSSGVKAPSTDAIDLDACSDVVIRGCTVNVNDDGVALKGGKGPHADTDPANGANERILVENCRYDFCHGCLTLGSEAVRCRNVLVRRCTVGSANNLLWLKMRPDTPQRYEWITMEDLTGRAQNAVTVRPWTQFFDNGGVQVPVSTAEHIRLRRCSFDCGTALNVAEAPEQYLLTDFALEDCSLREGALGGPSGEALSVPQ